MAESGLTAVSGKAPRRGWRSRLDGLQRADPGNVESMLESLLEKDLFFMREALHQAETAASHDEVPVGCLITLEDRILAKAYNQVELLKDPTAHAEMIAITQASHSLSCKWLTDCTMFVTVEPCSMCAGALVLARVKRLCFGAFDEKAGACGSVCNIVQSDRLNHRLDVQGGVMADACGGLMSEFFEKKRLRPSLQERI